MKQAGVLSSFMYITKRIELLMVRDYNSNLGTIIKQQRLLSRLTLANLSKASEVSSSHLARVERGERFPSARILRRIAIHLGFNEGELLTLAGYLSPQPSNEPSTPSYGRLDPYVARVLSEEPVEVQRKVIMLLVILKSVAKGT